MESLGRHGSSPFCCVGLPRTGGGPQGGFVAPGAPFLPSPVVKGRGEWRWGAARGQPGGTPPCRGQHAPGPPTPTFSRREGRRRPAWAAAWLVAGLLVPAGAQAQSLLDGLVPQTYGRRDEPGVTVATRERPDFARLGVRVGGITVLPELTEALGYDDNVTGTKRGRGSSLLLTRFNVQAASDLSRYGAAVRLTVDDFRYFDVPELSLTNWTASLGGRYEIGRDTLTAGYSHANLNQTPRDLDTPLIGETTAFRVDTVRVGYRTTFNRLSLTPDLSVSRYDFDDGTVGGVPFPQQFRNRVVVTPSLTANYELAPRRNLVAVFRNAVARYTDTPAGAPGRDFNDASLLAGVDFDAGGPWRVRALAGYGLRTFSSAAFKTIQAPILEGTVIYTPTGLTTLTGTVARRIQDSSSEVTQGFTETAFRLSVDHEYLRNVLLRGRAGVTTNEYSGGGSQTLYFAGAGATWLLNRNLRLAATYDFAARRSDGRTPLALDRPATGSGLGQGRNYNESRTLLQLSFGL